MPLGGLDMEIEILDGGEWNQVYTGDEDGRVDEQIFSTKGSPHFGSLEGKFRHMMEHNFYTLSAALLSSL